MDVTEDGVPVFGQWNYRILCHPIKGIDLKLTDLKPIDNLSNRLFTNSSFDKYLTTRGARFSISRHSYDHEHKWGLTDEIMRQIPGQNNYAANITDEVYDLKKMDVFNDQLLNTGFYHRWYKVQETGANGEKDTHRGFADRNLFMAETTQARVAPASYQHCLFPNSPSKRTCATIEKRFTYAVPMEVVWLTPLNTWNPFGIVYKGTHDTAEAEAVKYGNRNGGQTPEKAYNGTHSKAYYLTPIHFFQGGEVDADSADTSTRGSVGVLDSKGIVRAVKSAGIRISLPEILGLGELRTRYPVVPVHAEGSPIWKELEALRDVVMDMGKYSKFFRTEPPFALVGQAGRPVAPPPPVHTVLHTSMSDKEPFHEHTVSLLQVQYNIMTRKKKTLNFVTSESHGHTHSIAVGYDRKSEMFKIIKCDGMAKCSDGHSSDLKAEV